MKVPISSARLAPINSTSSAMKAPCSGPICMPAPGSFAVSARRSFRRSLSPRAELHEVVVETVVKLQRAARHDLSSMPDGVAMHKITPRSAPGWGLPGRDFLGRSLSGIARRRSHGAGRALINVRARPKCGRIDCPPRAHSARRSCGGWDRRDKRYAHKACRRCPGTGSRLPTHQRRFADLITVADVDLHRFPASEETQRLLRYLNASAPRAGDLPTLGR